jgi:hypothetical protein
LRRSIARAQHLAELSEAAAAFVERQLGLSFEFQLAVLGQRDWFSPHGGAGMPYGIPWCSTSEALIVAPASLREGALINGPTEQADRRRVEFVTLHEYGHLASKRYFHPASSLEELPIPWFEELLATYFAYSFVAASNGEWTESARQEWIARVESYTPRQLSLDWSFMRTLPPTELAQTYGWYQYLLNARVADVHRAHGLAFLQKLKTTLPFDNLDKWSLESVLRDLEHIAPGFREWAARLKTDAKLVHHEVPTTAWPVRDSTAATSR